MFLGVGGRSLCVVIFDGGIGGGGDDLGLLCGAEVSLESRNSYEELVLYSHGSWYQKLAGLRAPCRFVTRAQNKRTLTTAEGKRRGAGAAAVEWVGYSQVWPSRTQSAQAGRSPWQRVFFRLQRELRLLSWKFPRWATHVGTHRQFRHARRGRLISRSAE